MEGNNSNQQSFRHFSDQLRLHGSNLANLSLNDSIWSLNHNSYAPAKKPESRRNFDTRVGQASSHHKHNIVNNNNNSNVDDGWKFGSGQANMGIDLNGGFNKGVYSNQPHNMNINHNQYGSNFDVGLVKGEDHYNHEYGMINGGKLGTIKKNKEVKKEKNNNNANNSNVNKDGSKNGVDKRFKSLPPSESLPRNETVGGYIFVCNNDTMEENLKRQLFGLPPRYRDSVRQITPGLPLFLYNYSNHQLHGIYEAASFGGTNIDPTAWEDKKNTGESRFPAQVRVHTRKLCEPLDEDAFRPILHHYDGPKFRLELSVPEALSLLDIFDDKKA